MKLTVEQIAQTPEVLGTHLQHLAKNPNDFFALVKINANLALRYAQAFSAGHALTLLSEAQASGLKLITKIVNLRPSVQGAAPYVAKSFDLPTDAEIMLDWAKKEFPHITCEASKWYDQYDEAMYTNKLYYKGQLIGTYDDGRAHRTEDFQKATNFTVYPPSNQNKKWSIKMNYASTSYEKYLYESLLKSIFEATQNHPLQLSWDQKENDRVLAQFKAKESTNANIASALLSKLDSTVFVLDQNGKRAGILNHELVEQPVKSWFFWRGAPAGDYIFEPLAYRKEFNLMGKIISLLSPGVAMRELQKPRVLNKSLMELFIEQIPNTQEPVKHALDKMRSIPERFFEGLMSGFHCDVLGLIKAKCNNLAKEFYHLAPGFMQRQYPTAASSFVESEQINFPADLPPAYQSV